MCMQWPLRVATESEEWIHSVLQPPKVVFASMVMCTKSADAGAINTTGLRSELHLCIQL